MVVSQSTVFSFDKDRKKPTTTIEKPDSTKFVPWGDDNLFPQTQAEECRKSTLIFPTLDKIARMIYSGGLVWGYLDYDDQGNEIFFPKMKENWDIMVALRKTAFQRFIMEMALDFVHYRNAFPELITDLGKTQIVQLKVQRARECRWGWQNTTTGLVDQCFINANWGDGGTAENSAVLPVIDPYYDPVGGIQATKGYNFIYPVTYPDVDNKFYHLVDWHGLRSGKWLKFSLQIPEFKEALMRNQSTIKYHLEVSNDYWNWRHKGFDKLTEPEQQILRDAFVDEYNTIIRGNENAGKTLMSITFQENGKEIPGLRITAIDDKMKAGIYIEDSQEASTHILTSLGVDPTLMGNGPGKNFGAGSGSDKGVAYNIYMSQIRPFQDLLLEPFGVMRDYNGWDEKLVFRFRNSLMQTESNRQKTTQKAG